jgi:hypothetical protein
MRLKKDEVSEAFLNKTNDGRVFIIKKNKVELYHILDIEGIEFRVDKLNFNLNAEAVKRILDIIKTCEGELGEQKQENKDNK